MSKKFDMYFKLCYVTVVICLTVYIVYTENTSLIAILSNVDKTEKYINSWGNLAPFAFILIQIFQVMVFFIPGEVIQISSGFLFGSIQGAILSIIGIIIGEAFTFGIGKILGNIILERLYRKKEYEVLTRLIMKSKNEAVIFLLFLLPGFPKDILGYLLGVTNVKFINFLFLSVTGRLPGIIITSLIGAKIHTQNYIFAIYLGLISIIVFLIGITKRGHILKFLNSFFK